MLSDVDAHLARLRAAMASLDRLLDAEQQDALRAGLEAPLDESPLYSARQKIADEIAKVLRAPAEVPETALHPRRRESIAERIAPIDTTPAMAGGRTAPVASIHEALSETVLARVLASPATPADDLTRIRGIGARLAAQLEREGVRMFAQIAAWLPADVARVSSALALGRAVSAQNWIEQAALLAGAAPPRPIEDKRPIALEPPALFVTPPETAMTPTSPPLSDLIASAARGILAGIETAEPPVARIAAAEGVIAATREDAESSPGSSETFLGKALIDPSLVNASDDAAPLSTATETRERASPARIILIDCLDDAPREDVARPARKTRAVIVKTTCRSRQVKTPFEEFDGPEADVVIVPRRPSVIPGNQAEGPAEPRAGANGSKGDNGHDDEDWDFVSDAFDGRDSGEASVEIVHASSEAKRRKEPAPRPVGSERDRSAVNRFFAALKGR